VIHDEAEKVARDQMKFWADQGLTLCDIHQALEIQRGQWLSRDELTDEIARRWLISKK